MYMTYIVKGYLLTTRAVMMEKVIRIEGYLFFKGKIVKNPQIEILGENVRITEGIGSKFTHRGFAIPGIVNAHVHLDFDKPINERNFINWIERIITKINPTRNYVNYSEKISYSLELGITKLYDITGNASIPKNNSVVSFLEIIGADKSDIVNVPESMMISLHAPYSVSQNYAIRMINYYKHKSFCMHFLETEEEVKFLKGEKNEFEDRIYKLVNRKRETDKFEIPGEFLIKLGYKGLDKALVHFVHVSNRDIEIASKLNNSVIICPRSNLFFSGKLTPIKKLLDSGINIAIGTDGLGSSPNLNLWEEMRLVYLMERIPIEEVFKMVTTNALRIVKKREIVDNGLVIFECKNRRPIDTLLEILFQAENLKKEVIYPITSQQ